MQLHEKALRVSIEPALSYLIRLNLNERVMPAFLLHAHVQRSKQSGKSAGSRCVRGTFEWKCRKEFVGDLQYFDRRELRAKEMSHVLRSRSCWIVHRLNPRHGFQSRLR